METDNFIYKPLTHEAGVFRLLRLKKGTGMILEGELVQKILSPEDCRYEAVSYTWGGSDVVDDIYIDQRRLGITLNLSLILHDLRLADEDRVLWIDAICINQGDITERGHQVQQMRSIYSNAGRVLFCVSQPNEMTDVLMSSLTALQEEISRVDATSVAKAWRTVQSKLGDDHFGLEQRQRYGLEHVLTQPWFSRVWILQEVANARDAWVYCGKRHVPASVFAISPGLITIRRPEDQRYKSVLSLMPGSLKEHIEAHQNHDLFSLLRMFSSAQASEEYDKIYALLGMCTDTADSAIFEADYKKSVEEVIRDAISHICQCNIRSLPGVFYDSISSFLNELENLDNHMLSHFLRVSDVENASSLLRRRRKNVIVSSDMIRGAAKTTMQDGGVLDMLLECEGSKAALSDTKWTPLWWAAEHGYEPTVRLLLKLGAHANMKDESHKTALILAAENGKEATARLLLEFGAYVDFEDMGGEWALLLASKNGHEATVRLLLKHEANVHNRDKGIYAQVKEELLCTAATNGQESIIKLLIQHDADIPTQISKNQTILLSAAENGHEATVEVLLKHGALIDNKDINKRTELSWAAEKGHNATIRVLLGMGADIEAQDQQNWTPLHFASYSGRVKTVKLLLDMGANIEARAQSNFTPLHWACYQGRTETVRLLLDFGANVNARSKRGATPLDWANPAVTQLLRDRGLAVREPFWKHWYKSGKKVYKAIVQTLKANVVA
jgi:ankyrin repeat protein